MASPAADPLATHIDAWMLLQDLGANVESPLFRSSLG
jgi:hypothetical protein